MATIAILGTGTVGTALAGRILQASAGDAVFGVRDGATSVTTPHGDVPARPLAQAVAGADIVLLAVPAAAAVDAVRGAGGLAGTVVVDCTNPVRWEGGPVWAPPAEGSVAQAIAAACPGARVVKGFNHFGRELMADPVVGGRGAEALFASDDAEAKARVLALAAAMGFVARDAGPLRNAGLLENLAVLWIHLASVGGAGREWAFVAQGRGDGRP